MKLRKNAAPASPAALLDNVRRAQADHAAEVAVANARLISAHDSIYAETTDRRATIREQIELLSSEHVALGEVQREIDTAA